MYQVLWWLMFVIKIVNSKQLPEESMNDALKGFYPAVPSIPVPMTTFFEPVIHDHPPLHVIKKIIKKEKKRWRFDDSDEYSSSDTDSSNIDSNDSTDTNSDEFY
ncbi:unnamed protein product [Euphydryas editha]|uniref:Uncharacterized protein n=1 Tax=Euphydryas editha TaxID=104508 RepID=A0AAU9TFT3_EUPED|nr:unnamed protein product [Euphydryas editha]